MERHGSSSLAVQWQLAQGRKRSILSVSLGAQGKLDATMISRDELRRLFMLRPCDSDTHDSLSCKRCPPKPALVAEGEEAAAEAPGACVRRADAASCVRVLASWAPLSPCMPSPFPAPLFCVPLFHLPYPSSGLLHIRAAHLCCTGR
jgi:hypothetical protein